MSYRLRELERALGRIELTSEREWNSLEVPAQARIIAELEDQLRVKLRQRRDAVRNETMAARAEQPDWGRW